MAILLHTRVRFDGEPAPRLLALTEAMGGDWQLEPEQPGPLLRARCNQEGRAITIELQPRSDAWLLELATHPVMDLNNSSTAIGVVGGLCVAGSIGAGIYVIVPLGFQLALPVGILVFLGTTFGLAVAVPIVLDKLRRGGDDHELAVKIREVVAQDDALELA